jgi:hypothetical protein
VCCAPCPALPCPALPCPALPCPAAGHRRRHAAAAQQRPDVRADEDDLPKVPRVVGRQQGVPPIYTPSPCLIPSLPSPYLILIGRQQGAPPPVRTRIERLCKPSLYTLLSILERLLKPWQPTSSRPFRAVDRPGALERGGVSQLRHDVSGAPPLPKTAPPVPPAPPASYCHAQLDPPCPTHVSLQVFQRLLATYEMEPDNFPRCASRLPTPHPTLLMCPAVDSSHCCGAHALG